MSIIKSKINKPDPMDSLNVTLPHNAIWGIYARQSTQAQIVKHNQSTEMQTDDLMLWIKERHLQPQKIHLFDADLGVSGTLRIDQRTGLQELVARIEDNEVQVVLVYQISRLFRDETGVQYNVFATKCKEHQCLLVTADGMVFNFNNPMHVKMFRFLAELAAEYIPTHIKLLHQARLRKARQGFYAGQGTIPSGYIVDYNEDSPTYGKLTVYPGHKAAILYLFERFYELSGNLNALCREVDALPFVFPDFEPSVDKRNTNHWKKRKHVPGGFKLKRFGVRSILTNPVYLGWWVVQGELISQDNHEPLLDKEHEYLFWYAFDRLSDYTIEGEKNDKRQKRQASYYQTKTNQATITCGILKDRIEAEGAKVYVHHGKTKYNYILSYSRMRGGVTAVGDCQIDATTVDAAFSECFFAHLKHVHELDEYQRFLEKEQKRQISEIKSLQAQLLDAESQQEAMLDEITAIRRMINAQIQKEQQENPSLDRDKRYEELEKENQPLLQKLRTKYAALESLKGQLQEKLVNLSHETDEEHQTRQFASFSVELQKLEQVWEKKPFLIRKEFVNLFVSKAVITLTAPHWVILRVTWSYPAWEDDIIYLWRYHGAQDTWTKAEEELIRQYHQTRNMERILQILPTKTWKAIKRKGLALGLKDRPRTNLCYPQDMTWLDLQFMQAHKIDKDTRTKWISVSLLE
ncbi:recombinase family protein [Dictyobacter formicarum]|uniref:Resolvase/invertase-type recombinase catalytic domain-containing protein n=1 Tax=Dictyobacter formicarum TaxID=2778368 RepID=A0ABQ3VG70_9CHLR|nr:recombinase family protein [Dictyobacter formicarum]GHO85184.1 hypothetical protein KSZ_31900 [Dictyobacter formicarum]